MCLKLASNPFRRVVSPPIIQSSMYNTTIFVYLTLTISIAVYVRFCSLVIDDITNHLGIACFTVRRKDEYGVWRPKGHKNTTPELDEKRVS